MAKANAPERRQEPLVGVDRAKIHAAIGQVSQQLADVAPAGYDLTKLEDMAMAAIKTGRNMAQATMRSLLASLFHCAKVGLYPGDRQHCHLLSRKVKGTQTIQFQMGYQGYVELARRSGEIDKIEARVVHENDEFSWEYGTSPFIRHVGNLNPTPEKFKACYAVAKLAGVTEKQFVVMVPYEIAKIKECADITEWSPWVKWEASMWQVGSDPALQAASRKHRTRVRCFSGSRGRCRIVAAGLAGIAHGHSRRGGSRFCGRGSQWRVTTR